MSKEKNIAVMCPSCVKEYKTNVLDFFNLQSEGGDLSPILTDSLVKRTCAHCGFTGLLNSPLVFFDMEKKFALFFFPGMQKSEKAVVEQINNTMKQKPMENYLFRIVKGNYNDFKEKILQLESGLDDRICEAYKYTLKKINEGISEIHIDFENLTPLGFVALLSDGREWSTGFHPEFYQLIEKFYDNKFNSQPLFVDEKYAEAILEGYKHL